MSSGSRVNPTDRGLLRAPRREPDQHREELVQAKKNFMGNGSTLTLHGGDVIADWIRPDRRFDARRAADEWDRPDVVDNRGGQ